jgi:DNA-binding response OmpR family regulator
MAMGRGRRNVLLVEDHPGLRGMLREVLEDLGLETQEAADGHAAMNVLARGAPDLVCLDLVLPVSSGYEVCQFMRATPSLAQVPVLVISGRDLPHDRAYAAEVGADAFLSKPFNTQDFTARVRALLARRSAARPADVAGEA